MTQCQAKKTGDNEQTNAWARYDHKGDKEREKNFRETMNILAKQREGRSGQYLADSATFAICCSEGRSCLTEPKIRICRLNREVVNTREKGRWSWLSRPGHCENVLAMVPNEHLWNPSGGKSTTEHDCTYCGFQPATPYTRSIWRNVFIPATTQHAAQVRKISDREAGQDGGVIVMRQLCSIVLNDKCKLQEHFDTGRCTSW